MLLSRLLSWSEPPICLFSLYDSERLRLLLTITPCAAMSAMALADSGSEE